MTYEFLVETSWNKKKDKKDKTTLVFNSNHIACGYFMVRRMHVKVEFFFSRGELIIQRSIQLISP